VVLLQLVRTAIAARHDRQIQQIPGANPATETVPLPHASCPTTHGHVHHPQQKTIAIKMAKTCKKFFQI
jgi:hypothetical protein